MAYTNKFRAQHGELLNVVKSIVQLLDANGLRNDAKEVRHLLSVLHGKLSVHLAMEDKSLYPRLLRHHDSDIRATTQRYIDEMGSLAGAFTAGRHRRQSSRILRHSSRKLVACSKRSANVSIRRTMNSTY
jgi:hypothetical protein